MMKNGLFLPSLILLSIGVSFALLQSNGATKASATPPDEDYQSHEPGGPFRFYGGHGEEGRAAFETLGCVQCHTVVGQQVAAPKGKRRLNLELGSEIRFAKRYEDLLLAITNPRHVVTERYWAILSPAERQGAVEPMMPDLTDHMTARQLVDIVTFLDQSYTAGLPGYALPE